MIIYIVFDKDNKILSIHQNKEYAMQTAKDYIRTFGFCEEDNDDCFEMLARDGYVEEIVGIEVHEVHD